MRVPILCTSLGLACWKASVEFITSRGMGKLAFWGVDHPSGVV
ncbi:hypothetical protein [Anaerolinea thermophila]|nr:hypothetical protein [Anaerolinea thermophila]